MDKQPTTNEAPVSQTKQEIIKEAKRIEESTLYSAKGHFVAARIWTNFHLFIGVPNAVLAAGAATLVLSNLDTHHVTAGIISIVVAGLVALQTFLNPNERAGSHLNAGNSYDSLQNRVRIFRSIECWQEESERLLAERVREFADQKDKLNRTCPQVPTWAYKIAKRGILEGEASYTVDKEG